MSHPIIHQLAPTYINAFQNILTHNYPQQSFTAAPSFDPELLGAMTFGHSPGAVLINPQPYPQIGGGVFFVVNQNGGLAAPVSRTVYLVTDKLKTARSLRAEVSFDLPNASKQPFPVAPLAYKWAIGLNFKKGNENDLPTDRALKIGFTCQFYDFGKVHFNMVNFDSGNAADPANVDNRTYDAYSKENTQFVLSTSIQREIGPGSGQGTATLKIGNNAPFEASLKNPPPNIDVDPAADFIDAVGVAIVNPTNAIPQINVRLKQFSLWILP